MLLQKLVLAVDFSEASKTAARWAVQHLAPKAEHVFVHCIDAPVPPAFLLDALPHHEQWMQTLHAGAEQRLRALIEELGAGGARLVLTSGRPAEALAEIADAGDADLVVVGEHGQRRGLGSLLGSVPEKLAGLSRVPVLVARGLPEAPPQTILVALDESDAAASALEWADSVAPAFGARLVVCHVISSWYHDQARRMGEEHARNLLEAQKQAAAEWLEQLVDKTVAAPGSVLREVGAGAPDLELLACAQRHSADLVVLGSPGAGGVLRPLLGSVTRTLLRHGRTSTCIVPAPAAIDLA